MKPEQISFSVIIPNYNNGSTLRRSIESVLAQTYAAHEIIIIDDGSSDDSRQVAEAFGSKVRYVHQANAGVSAARNHGARLATGNWLAFLDADDVYMPERLKAHAAWIEREPDVDFLFADQESRKPSGEFIQCAVSSSASGRNLAARHPGKQDIPIAQSDFEELIADGFSEIRTLSLPRQTFLELGGFPLNRKIGEDLYFFVQLFCKSRKGGLVNKPLAVYYIYPTSALRKDALGAQRAFVETLEALQPELRDAGAAIKRGWRAKLRQARLSLAYMHLRVGKKRAALACVAPLMWRQPSIRSVKDLASIARGMP